MATDPHPASSGVPFGSVGCKQEFNGDWEVIVVDDRSIDVTAEKVAAVAPLFDRVRLVVAAKHADKSHALNIGVAATDADGFAFTDADDIVMSGWVAAAVEALEQDASFEGLFPMVQGTNYAMTREAWTALGELPLAT